jgi:glyoxylase-like metal-dependent hydrolase (beta-lactamase superfamily II)
VPNVQEVMGSSHNGMTVAMKDHLVAFDARINSWQTRFTITAARAKYPGRPIKYRVLTHHHTDHVGGARTYVAEGTTVTCPSAQQGVLRERFHGATPGLARRSGQKSNARHYRRGHRPHGSQGRHRRNPPLQQPQPAFPYMLVA